MDGLGDIFAEGLSTGAGVETLGCDDHIKCLLLDFATAPTLQCDDDALVCFRELVDCSSKKIVDIGFRSFLE